jgi:hypothetical protein
MPADELQDLAVGGLEQSAPLENSTKPSAHRKNSQESSWGVLSAVLMNPTPPVSTHTETNNAKSTSGMWKISFSTKNRTPAGSSKKHKSPTAVMMMPMRKRSGLRESVRLGKTEHEQHPRHKRQEPDQKMQRQKPNAHNDRRAHDNSGTV